MSFFRNPLKWVVNNLLPQDKSDRAGLVHLDHPSGWIGRPGSTILATSIQQRVARGRAPQTGICSDAGA